MSFSTVWNPLSGTTNPLKKKLWAFYISSKFHLGLRQWDAEEKANTFWVDGSELPTGSLDYNAPLAALQLRDWIRVYGITRGVKEGKTEPSYYISLLSPVLRSLAIEVGRPALAGASDGSDEAWLYYINGDPAQITEIPLTEGGGTSTVIDKDTKFLLGPAKSTDKPTTELAAYYVPDTKQRFVVFQVQDGSIRVVNPALKSSGIRIEESENARLGTPLAATSYVNKNKVVVQVVYYVKNNGQIAKASKKGSDDWGLRGEVKGNVATPSATSTLSVSAHNEGAQNIIVYNANGGGKADMEMRFTLDPWET